MASLLVFLIGTKCTVAQSNDGSFKGSTINQGTSYFYYQQPEYPKDCNYVLSQCSSSNVSGVHVINPIGYSHPFEVYCESENNSRGWTIIQRRLDGSISFNRSWENLKNGFGFLSGEFWLGNDKLSYLTNQGVYELRIDLTLDNGSYFYISYNPFRISDEWNQYAIVSTGSFEGNGDNAVTHCPLHMIYGTCSCQPTCSNPNGTNSCNRNCEETESCICADGFLKKGVECVTPSECGCYVTEINKVVPNGESYINNGCTEKYTCQNDELNSDSNYRCSPNAECIFKDGVRQCHCNEGFEGDGETCSPLYTDCYDAYQAGHTEDGVYTILPSGWPASPFNVSCVMSTNGGGWTVFQRRSDGVTDFYQNWTSYRYGFGSSDGDFWLGNEQLHYLTNQKNYKLRVDIITSGGSSKYDEYTSFRINSNNNKFRIDDIGSHSGSATNGMRYTNGRSFSTYDQDNDGCGNHNCAQRHRGAWWYANDWCSSCWSGRHCTDFQYSSSCTVQCAYSNPNGDYNGGNGEHVIWYDFCHINFSEMKIRPT